MKDALKAFFRNIGYAMSFLFPYRLDVEINRIGRLIFSGFIKSQFKSVGDDFNVARPIYMAGGKYITIGSGFTAMPGMWIDAIERYESYNYSPRIIIGDNVTVNLGCHIACIHEITIGNNVLIASKVHITDHYHGDTNQITTIPPNLRPLVSKGPVNINDNVWIGENVVVMPNVTIGENCIIGANSVVTKSFPPNSVVAGIPARLIKAINTHE